MPESMTSAEYAVYRRSLLTELEFQREVIQEAVDNGWEYHHETDSRKTRRGFPDLTLAHPERGVVFLEVKREKNPSKYTPEQRYWIRLLQLSGQIAAKAQPRDWDWIVRVLKGEATEIPPHRMEVDIVYGRPHN